MKVFRLAGLNCLNDTVRAMDGNGGLYGPARWHRQGVRIVYLGSTLALCTLEMKVQDQGMMPAYAGFQVDIPDSISRRAVDQTRLPPNWRARDQYPECQDLGMEWLTGISEPALLIVPSSVIPSEFNVLLNPLHPDARSAMTISMGRISTDSRLL